MSVLYIYLGRRGGGFEFNRLMHEFLGKNQIKDALFVNSSAVQKDFQNNGDTNVIIFTPSKILETPKYLLSLLHAIYRLIKKRNRFNTAVLLMASPWDLPILRIIKLFRKKLVVLVHDLQPHPGEKWPRKKSIIRRIRLSDKLVFLGDSTARQYNDREKNQIKPHITIKHPAFFYEKNNQPAKVSDDSFDILFIGRIVEYKGLAVLNDALQKFKGNKLKVLIAGEGELGFQFPSYVKVINRWLSWEEIKDYIRNARLIVFPYIEASQSGLIPICMSMQKNLVISDVKGLVSQTLGYDKLTIFKSGDSEHLANVLIKFLKARPVLPKVEIPLNTNILNEDEFARNLHHFAMNCD